MAYLGAAIASNKLPKKLGIVNILAMIGWVLFAGTCFIALDIGTQISGIMGFAMVLTGIVQLLVFLAFSAIIGQLPLVKSIFTPRAQSSVSLLILFIMVAIAVCA
jgi:hypothetical protein